jgi:hypothetical protein
VTITEIDQVTVEIPFVPTDVPDSNVDMTEFVIVEPTSLTLTLTDSTK